MVWGMPGGGMPLDSDWCVIVDIELHKLLKSFLRRADLESMYASIM